MKKEVTEFLIKEADTKMKNKEIVEKRKCMFCKKMKFLYADDQDIGSVCRRCYFKQISNSVKKVQAYCKMIGIEGFKDCLTDLQECIDFELESKIKELKK